MPDASDLTRITNLANALGDHPHPADEKQATAQAQARVDALEPLVEEAAAEGRPSRPGQAPAPLPPEVISAILRDPDSPLYPSKIGVFCDDCEITDSRDYMVSTEQTKAERLEVARAHLRAQGWSCTEAGDYCPSCRMAHALAPLLAEVTAERGRQDEQWGQQNHPDGTGPARGTHLLGRTFAALAQHLRAECQAAAARGEVTWAHIALEEDFEAYAETDPARLRAELIQSIAVRVAWVEALDRRQARVGGACAQHPHAPVIAGYCGGCTVYPADLAPVREPRP